MGNGIERKQLLHHVLHLLFFGGARADDGELDLARSELADGKRLPAAQATSAAPRAWLVPIPAVTFSPNQTVSMPTHSGSNRVITALI